MTFWRPAPLPSELEKLLAMERELEPESPQHRRRVLARAWRAAGQPPGVGLLSRARWAAVIASVLLLASASFARYESHAAPMGRAEVLVAHGGTVGEFPDLMRSKASKAPMGLVPQTEPHATVRSSRAVRAAPGAPADALELELLQRARLLLLRGDFSSASNTLAEHRRRFPASLLGEEREALRIRALAGLGRSGEVRRASAEFRRRYPKSVLTPRGRRSKEGH